MAATEGHRAGGRVLREITRACASAGTEILTVFAFSSENWQREPAEVLFIMALLAEFARTEQADLVAENVRVRVIGRRQRLPADTRAALDDLVTATAASTGVTLNLAIDYGGRTELCDAIRTLALEVAKGKLTASSIDEDSLSQYLYTAGLPDPDLMIRTGGELRVSNFLLYQLAYTELWATVEHWPSFTPQLLHAAFADYAKRQRRFGK